MAGLEVLISLIISLGGVKFLIIAPDEFMDELAPLYEWRMDEGYRTELVPLSAVGFDENEIRNFLIEEYANQFPDLEFVLLAGSASIIPFHFDLTGTDNFYANLDTTTFENDVYIGRLPAENEEEISLMVQRILCYEREPDTASRFLEKATFIIRCDGDEDDSLYFNDAFYVMGLMQQNGFWLFDTLSSCPPYCNNAQDVIDALEEGRGFLLYRGQAVTNWWSPFQVDPFYVYNGKKLPIIVSATCQTVSCYPDFECIGEKWLKTGTPFNLRGAVSFFGTTTIRNDAALIRSVVARGFFEALLEDSVALLGMATEMAKRKLLDTLGDVYDYEGFTLLGDPLMKVWTSNPKRVSVFYPDEVPGVCSLNVYVRDGSVPISGARVTLRRDTLLMVKETSEQGIATFYLDFDEPCTLNITVTGFNIYPYRGTLICGGSSPSIVLLSYNFQDEDGNGRINPGENINLSVTVLNSGSSALEELKVHLLSFDSLITPIDSISTISLLQPQDSTNIQFSFHVSNETQDGYTGEVILDFGDYGEYAIPFVVYAPNLRILMWWVEENGNASYLSPFEDRVLLFAIENIGNELFDGTIKLHVPPQLQISDSIFCLSLPPFLSEEVEVTAVLDSVQSRIGKLPVVIEDSTQYGAVDSIQIELFYGAYFFENFSDSGSWSHFSSGGCGDEWHLDELNSSVDSTHSFACNNGNFYSPYLDSWLLSPWFKIPSDAYLVVYMRASTEAPQNQYASDGLYLAILSDSNFQFIEPVEGYPYISNGNSAIPEGTGIIAGDFGWRAYLFALSQLEGFHRFLFRFSSDGELEGEGVWIDDIIVGEDSLVLSPHILMDSLSFKFTMSIGDTLRDSLKIYNPGLDTLLVTIDSTSLPEWLYLIPLNVLIPPLGEGYIGILVEPRDVAPGMYSDDVKFESNDPLNPDFECRFTLELLSTPVNEKMDKNVALFLSTISNKDFVLFANASSPVELKVYDVSGRLFYRRRAEGKSFHFGSDFSSGVYFAIVEAGGKRRIYKLIKLRGR